MKARDLLGLLCIAAGFALASAAWSVRRSDWGLMAAVLLVLGLVLIWRRERSDDIHRATAEIQPEGFGWRLGRRRGDADDDGGGADADGD